MKNRTVCGYLFIIVCLAVSTHPKRATVAGETLPSAALPDDKKIVIRDYNWRDWPAAVLHYRLPPGRFKDGPVRVVAGDGQAVPAQINGDTLCFVAALPKGGTATFSLAEGEPAASALRIAT
ncbi:MAG: hypothetical protein N3A66_01055, partial [Planctomycetota bacterium]|nr:hypothetical protein [Planctomycetota bacterium]